MEKKLVIVESPAKAKTINKILGKDYIVRPSMGHVRDLPEKNLGVEIENNFKPKYVLVNGRKKVIDELKKAAQECNTIYLAPDPDREGEAIAWHLQHILNRKENPPQFFRVQYNEITPRAISEAFANPGQIDIKRVNAQQARRILDRIVGYMVSPVLWREIRRGLSAGRVQSVALRLVCEREEEIRKFVPQEYWIMGALVRKFEEPLTPFKIKLMRINDKKADVKTSQEADKIKADLDGRQLRVAEIAMREITKSPPPPFITSSLQQAASTYCGYSPKRTMSIAQKLYEGVDLGDGPVGLITYMRTDSFTVSQDALQSCRQYITQTFGQEFCPPSPNYFKSKSGAQEAHEAIRPTDVSRTPESIASRLDPSELKVYKLIWQRFTASQMTPAKILQRTVKVEAIPQPGQVSTYLFHATASEIIFPGYMRVSGEDAKPKKKDDEAEEVQPIPPVKQGEHLDCMQWLGDRKETQPPGRYSEASLIRALENNGVGRPSTYAQTVSTLHQRNYVILNQRQLQPTEIGMSVSSLLVAKMKELFDVGFTAAMESKLDEVEKGALEWTSMLAEFYTRFSEWMVHAKAPAADIAVVNTYITSLESVTEWGPETTRGKRTYSDKKFVESIKKQVTAATRDISKRQLDALARIACRYSDKTPSLKKVLSETGYEALLTEPKPQPPKQATMTKLDLLKAVVLPESTTKFVASLRMRAESGRDLTPAQIRALDDIVLSNATKIKDFDVLKPTLNIQEVPTAMDAESEIMLKSLISVSQWKPPTTRGRKVFDDKAFFESLTQHFDRKHFLTDRQKAALRKMVERYRDQVPNYEGIVRGHIPPPSGAADTVQN